MKGQPVKNGIDYQGVITLRSGGGESSTARWSATYGRAELTPVRLWEFPSGVLLPHHLEELPAFISAELHHALMSVWGVQGILLDAPTPRP